jgi:hypothetical protein
VTTPIPSDFDLAIVVLMEQSAKQDYRFDAEALDRMVSYLQTVSARRKARLRRARRKPRTRRRA